MPRQSCVDCGRKHLAQACVLALEALKGYPEHAWLAVGHMAEAEDELVVKYPEISAEIRHQRLAYMQSLDGATPPEGRPYPDFLSLINSLSEQLPQEDVLQQVLPLGEDA